MAEKGKLTEKIRLITTIAEAAGILLIALGLLYSHRQLEQSSDFNRKAFTFDLLGDLSENGDLAEANFHMTRLINERVHVSDESVSDEMDRQIIALLNYYELIGTAYQIDALDKNLVLHVRGGPMARAFEVCEEYIGDRRRLLRRPKLYENFERVVQDYYARGLDVK